VTPSEASTWIGSASLVSVLSTGVTQGQAALAAVDDHSGGGRRRGFIPQHSGDVCSVLADGLDAHVAS
jgi:hypothetical protein